MDILGIISNNKKEILLDTEKVNLDNFFVFIKGKIFNLPELCEQYSINSCKAEIFIEQMYIKFGINFIKKLDGNFVIVIFDSKTKNVYLVKDKLGSIPFYYYMNNDIFIYSTSLKMIMKHKLFDLKINKQALANFFGYMYIYEPYTIFENTYKLEKGMILLYHNNKIKKKKYFSLYKEYKKIKKINVSDDTLEQDFDQLFLESLKKCGDKSSQVGIFMSSGKDSTLLAKIASDYFNQKINTYTLGFENERDESVAANEIAKYIGSKHHTIILHDKDVLKTIKKIALICEEPFADPSIVPNIYMMENIQEKNDFYLAGEGIDTIFMHSNIYDIYNIKERIELYKEKLHKRKKHRRTYQNFSEMAQNSILRRFVYSDKIVGVKGKVYKIKKMINKRRSIVIGSLDNIVPEKERIKSLIPLKNYVNGQYYTPYYTPDILLKSFAIKTNKLYKNGEGKYIFNKVLYRHIPEKYYSDYKKNGFGFPMIDWVNRIMLSEIEKISIKEKIDEQSIFNYYELQNLIASFKLKPEYSKAVVLWCYYIFQLWYYENII